MPIASNAISETSDERSTSWSRHRRPGSRLLTSGAARRGSVAAVCMIMWVVVPLNTSDSTLTILTYCGAIAIAAIGLVLLSGYGGQLSFAQPAFMAIGAYTCIELGAVHHLPFLVYLVAAVALSAVIGTVVGLVALRLEGPQLAIVTLGVLLFSQYLANQWISVTGGENGRSASEAAMSIGSLDFRSVGGLTSSQSLFLLVWALVALVACVTLRVLRQRPGYVLHAIRANWRAAETLGVNVRREKLKAFAWSSALGGLAGVLYVSVQHYVAPADFGLDTSVLILAALAVGGAGSITGAVVGSIIVWGGNQWIATNTGDSWLSSVIKIPGDSSGLISPGDLVTLCYGLLIVIVLLIEPSGLAGLVSRLTQRAISRRIRNHLHGAQDAH
jgi:branched-chain amino acid transport system permease protein